VLINITGGHDLTLFELDEAANRIREEVDPDANIIVGSTLDVGMEGRMRVSVVATGIDASDKSADVPAPRRTLAQPLKQPEAVEAAVHADAAAQTAAPEPSLFDQVEEMQPETADDSDGLPPPAYRPSAEEAVTAAEAEVETDIEDELDSFLAPRAPAPGTPSPEALRRLHAAVGKAPQQAQQRRPAPAPSAAAQPAAEERPRFGINSLINRMTGHAAAEAPRPTRQQPTIQTSHAPQPAPRAQEEEDQIEIPAFLRRQAN
jgi:cell division protein FtsZ